MTLIKSISGIRGTIGGGPENPLVVQALPYGHRNLLAQLYILSLGGPVHGSIGYGQCVHAGLAEKFNRLQGIGISGTL